jgi:hypothetical protein
MTTTHKKARTIKKATDSERARSGAPAAPKKSPGLSTAQKNDLPDSAFAFAKRRKEPLLDAKHVRNAVARFDQVEGVSDEERDRAWRRIRAAARKFDVEITERGWRNLGRGARRRKRR